MNFHLRSSVGVMISCILTILMATPPGLQAQQRTVSSADVRKELVNATQTRRQNREKLNELFSSRASEKFFKKAGLDLGEVKAGISTLSDAELAQLASRADKTREDFAAGRLSDRDLLIVLLGIAALILIIVAVR